MAVEHGDDRKVVKHTVQVVRAKLIVRDKCGCAQAPFYFKSGLEESRDGGCGDNRSGCAAMCSARCGVFVGA